MEKFSIILERATERKGGNKALQALMPEQASIKQLCALSDRDYLSAMSKKIFQSGFIWRVVENK